MRSIDQANKAFDLIRDHYLLTIHDILQELRGSAFERSASLEEIRAAVSRYVRIIRQAVKGVETTVEMAKLELTIMSSLYNEEALQDPPWVESSEPLHLQEEIATVKDFVLRDFGGQLQFEFVGAPAACTDINAIRLAVKLLLENALKAIDCRPAGRGLVWSPEIDLSVAMVDSQVILNVVDNGMGIDAAKGTLLSQIGAVEGENARDADYRVLIHLCELARRAGRKASFQFVPKPRRAKGARATFTCEVGVRPANLDT